VEISTPHCASASNPVQISTIDVEQLDRLSVDAYPNPANAWLVVKATSGSTKSLTMMLYNSLGQVVWSKVLEVNMGVNEVHVDISAFASGIYQLRVSDDANDLVRRIEVLK
jgi:ABC-type enterobactin transport system permease subunit